MKMLSVQVEDKLAAEVDLVIKESGFFSSRSEFLKESIRKSIAEIQKRAAYRRKVHDVLREFGKKALAKGWDGSLLTREERDAIAREHIKENKIKIT